MEKRQIQDTELWVSPFGLGTADAGVAWKERTAFSEHIWNRAEI